MHINVPHNFSGIIQKTVVSDAAVKSKTFILCTRIFMVLEKSWLPESSLTRDSDGTIPLVALKCYRYSDPLKSAKEVYTKQDACLY
jgi:hypothetical protein